MLKIEDIEFFMPLTYINFIAIILSNIKNNG